MNYENVFLGTNKHTNGVVAIKYNPATYRGLPNEIKAHQEVLKAVKYTKHAKSRFYLILFYYFEISFLAVYVCNILLKHFFFRCSQSGRLVCV